MSQSKQTITGKDSRNTTDESNDTFESDKDSSRRDASRKEVAIYAFGNVEGAIADKFPETLQNMLIVVAHFNPVLIGLIMGIRTLWDGIMDPIMAHISDNTNSRWGRRRPYILVGGISRCLFLVAFVAFMPLGNQVSRNDVMEAQKFVSEGIAGISKSRDILNKAYAELPDADITYRARVIDIIEGRPPKSWITTIIELFTWKKSKSYLVQTQEYQDQIKQHLSLLEINLQERRERMAEQKANLQALIESGTPKTNTNFIKAEGLLLASDQQVETAKELIEQAHLALAQGIAVTHATKYLLTHYSDSQPIGGSDLASAQANAKKEMIENGYEPIPLFAQPPIENDDAATLPKQAEKKKSIWQGVKEKSVNIFSFKSMREGINAFLNPANFEQRNLAIYLLLAYLIFATLTTINSAPYYALGIEISPSYDGRTQVVVYRSLIGKITGLIAPWVPVFCFSLYFVNAIEGLMWVAIFACVIGIPSTALMFFKTRERTQATIKQAGERPNLIRSMLEISKQPEFLQILLLFITIGLTNALFAQIGFFLNVYWVTGSALSGATLGAQIAMLAWGLGIIMLPIIKWACDKFQKHKVLQFAIIWMSFGTALKWWLMDPEHPEYQFILPFFFSVGISSVYTILPSMMADATDLDELRFGVRREGMFGAVLAFIMKLLHTVTPIAAGVILVASGFTPQLEYRQEASTILNMRVFYSFVPAIMLLSALFVIRKYPLSRERVADIKAELDQRHATEAMH